MKSSPQHLDGDPIETVCSGPQMSVAEGWKVQLWLGDMLIEEHIAPAVLAERYADVIRLRIQGLPNRPLRCERVSVMDLAHHTTPSMTPG